MSMDWPNERWVKLYTRRTAEDLALPWEARLLWKEMLAEFDRVGIVRIKPGPKRTLLLASLLHVPMDFVELALPALLEDGRLVECDMGFIAPNFLAAQDARASDAERQRRHRETQRDLALAGVTKRDEMSRAVTPLVTTRRDGIKEEVIEPGFARAGSPRSSSAASTPEPENISPPPPHGLVIPEGVTRNETDSGYCIDPARWEHFLFFMRDAKQSQGVAPEPDTASLRKSVREWHARKVAPLREPLDAMRAFWLYLEDEDFAERGWPIRVFLTDAVCGPRFGARRKKRPSMAGWL